MWRTTFRVSPHNLYTNFARLATLTNSIGGKAPLTTSQFIFADPPAVSARPVGGTIVVPYTFNRISTRTTR